MRIKEERLDRGWTQQCVAEKLGITKAAYRNIEAGQRKPSFRTIIKIEDLFEMSYRVLFNLPKRPNGRST